MALRALRYGDVHAREDRIADHNVARITIPFRATGWGQRATLNAKAKRSDGMQAFAKCKVKFEHQQGNQKFSNFLYEDLGRAVLGDVAGDKLYINSGYSLHRQVFGETEDDFNKRLESDRIAQMRAATVLVETTVYHAATVKYQTGGAKGLQIDPDDPIGSLRPYVEERRMKGCTTGKLRVMRRCVLIDAPRSPESDR